MRRYYLALVPAPAPAPAPAPDPAPALALVPVRPLAHIFPWPQGSTLPPAPPSSCSSGSRWGEGEGEGG